MTLGVTKEVNPKSTSAARNPLGSAASPSAGAGVGGSAAARAAPASAAPATYGPAGPGPNGPPPAKIHIFPNG
jgi:hypothetical protein